ncbi:MAG: shikimate dehydrogenase [Enterococcus sp.]
MEITGYTQLAALFANPAKHSQSPRMHNLAFAERGIDARYFAFEITLEQLADSIASIRHFKMLGVNLSMPFKTAAIAYMDELTPAAQLIGAINTIVNQDGRLIGANTDGQGFMASIQPLIDPRQQTMTILGGGGAAIAIIAQAALDGVSKINVIVRNKEQKTVLATKLTTIAQQTTCDIQLIDYKEQQLELALLESCLLVNATSVGMAPEVQQTPLAKRYLRKDLFVCDIIYNPCQTQLLKDAQAVGAKTCNGLSMLVHQGAVAFELWTGQKMPIEKVTQLLTQVNKQ